MAIEVGEKLQGKVSGITNFGAFVDLGDRKTGLVHISEVSDGYVKDINEVLKVGDEVMARLACPFARPKTNHRKNVILQKVHTKGQQDVLTIVVGKSLITVVLANIKVATTSVMTRSKILIH